MNTKLSYKSWVNEVDSKVFKKLKLHLEDLPDELYRDNYDEGISTDEMAKFVIENNMIVFE